MNRNSEGGCEQITCTELGCEECQRFGDVLRCVCPDRSLRYPNCEKPRECSERINFCGTFAKCMLVNDDTIHCSCLFGGTHPQCKEPKNAICSQTTCRKKSAKIFCESGTETKGLNTSRNSHKEIRKQTI